MEIEIVHDQNLNLSGKGFTRKAVRSLIYNNLKVLLIYSSVNGDYKLPGGGVEEEETHEEALKREVKEECGLELKQITTLIGQINEYRKAKEESLDFFKMESTYYQCEILDNVFKEQKLDSYEKELDFKPVWISIEDAIINNKELMKSNTSFPPWTKRDTKFLEYIHSLNN